MQESRFDGSEKFTDRASMRDFKKAMDDPQNRSVTMHKPGSIVEMKTGSYVVDEDGSFRKIRAADMETFRMLESAWKREKLELELEVSKLRQEVLSLRERVEE